MQIEKIFDSLESSSTVPKLKLHFEPSRISEAPLKDAESIADFVREMFDPGEIGLREEIILLPLDAHNRPICWYRLASGSRLECPIDDNIVLMVCVAVGAHGFILAHNHPDELPIPSEADLEGAHTLKRKAHYMELLYHDDLIITNGDYYSLAENDLIWE